MNRRVVYIPGIGADQRAFSQLNVLGNYTHVYANWLSLKNPGESFDAYCRRLVEHYCITKDDILIGLSFGGLVAQKIASSLGNTKVVLVSSFRNSSDLKLLWKYCLRLKLHVVLPSGQIPLLPEVASAFLHSWRRKNSQVLKEMLKDADFKLIKWSLKQINQVDLVADYRPQFLSLIGDRDLLIRSWGAAPIKKGTHFMIYHKAASCKRLIDAYIQGEV